MNTLSEAGNPSRQTLRLAVTAAALSVVGMFTAAATFAGGEAQAVEATPQAELGQR